jgi:hypothetical protein
MVVGIDDIHPLAFIYIHTHRVCIYIYTHTVYLFRAWAHDELVVTRPLGTRHSTPRAHPCAIRAHKPDAHDPNHWMLVAQTPNPIYRASVPPAPDFRCHKSKVVSLPLPLVSAVDWVSSQPLGFRHQLDGTHGEDDSVEHTVTADRFRGAQGDDVPIPR